LRTAIFNQVFNENRVIVMLKSAADGLINFSLLWPIDIKLAVWVAYIKTQLGIATQVYVIKVEVTVTKKEKFSFRSITLVCFG